jgi:enamine deaminase RidA (YjgF/YER057c/UK114 family)
MEFRNPATVHTPLGAYSHQAEVSANARWLVLSGQLGMDKNGHLPEDTISQLEIALENVFLNLEAAGMSRENLVKLVFYIVGTIDTEQRRSVVKNKLGDHKPCMTVMYISGLATEEIKVEIDAWACCE